MSKIGQFYRPVLANLLPMASPVTILTVDLDGDDGIIVTFSDGTMAGYVVEELMLLRPKRDWTSPTRRGTPTSDIT